MTTEDTMPTKPDRRCGVCGALTPDGGLWCSTYCHRLDEPGAYERDDDQ
jgi:predicted nucleic acid-binding Zn ribbon protein